MLNPIVTHWFEIPVVEMERAMRFYGLVLEVTLTCEPFGSMELAVFPHDPARHVTGALLRLEHCVPSQQGSTVYLSVDDVTATLARVEEAGGTVVLPRTVLPEGRGSFAQFRDSEGNRVGLWAQQ